MSLNGILVASAILDPTRCKDKFYLDAMRRLMMVQNQEIIQLIPTTPVYYIEAESPQTINSTSQKSSTKSKVVYV